MQSGPGSKIFLRSASRWLKMSNLFEVVPCLCRLALHWQCLVTSFCALYRGGAICVETGIALAPLSKMFVRSASCEKNQHAFRNAISCGPNDVPLVCSYFPWQSFHSSQPFPCSKPYLIERTALNIVRGFDVKIALGKNVVSEYLVHGPQTHVCKMLDL